MASLALFHSTFGPGGDPIAGRARSILIDPDGPIDFVPRLMRMSLASSTTTGWVSVPLLLSMMRHVHNLVASEPSVAGRMDDAIREERSKKGTEEEEEGEGEGKGGGLPYALVSALAWTVRSDPPFPGDNPSDRRADLAIEVRLLTPRSPRTHPQVW